MTSCARSAATGRARAGPPNASLRRRTTHRWSSAARATDRWPPVGHDARRRVRAARKNGRSTEERDEECTAEKHSAPNYRAHGAAHETLMNPWSCVHRQPTLPTHEHAEQPPRKTQLYEVVEPAGPPVYMEQYWRSVHVVVPHGNVLPL